MVVPVGLEARVPPTAQGGRAAQDVPRQEPEGRSRRERHFQQSLSRSSVFKAFQKDSSIKLSRNADAYEYYACKDKEGYPLRYIIIRC